MENQPPQPPFTVRILTERDIPAAQRLRELAKWNQIDQDWRNLLSFEPNGCFVAEMDGRVVGSATSTRYLPNSGPGSFGWIGMVLVDPDYRRHGIGSTLLKRCIEYLKECGVETVKLDATPMGKLVYEKLGFRDEYKIERWEGVGSKTCVYGEIDAALSNASLADLDELEDYDAPIFGVRRRMIIEAWLRNWPECSLVARLHKQVVGYALARRGSNFQQIGPIIADDPRIGAKMLCQMLSRLHGQKVIIDFVTSNTFAVPIAQQFGLKTQRPLLRMAYGPNSSPGQREKILAICCPELG
jgi:ribosomal protein S18 acetylase RimI-like enzyme